MMDQITPARFVPHECNPQAVIHTAWPSNPAYWPDVLDGARSEFARFLTLLSAPSPGGQPLPLIIYAANAETEADARQRMGRRATIVREPYGDVWTRDTGPVFVKSEGGLKAVRFGFNGWGGKFQYPGDDTIGDVIARQAGARVETLDWICEGGALEFDGEGTVLTTRDVLLNANRNPRLTEAQVEADLKAVLGVQRVIWLDKGLAGDHTDGHIDNLARFAGPGRVVCQTSTGADDPNADLYSRTINQLKASTDAKGRQLCVVEIPSPGFVADEAGAPVAASHLNWVIGPHHVVVPAYNHHADRAVRILDHIFVDREVVASSANHILTGGGAFHCVTCNQPR